MEKIGIIGSGTWGTAIAVLLRNNGKDQDSQESSGSDVAGGNHLYR